MVLRLLYKSTPMQQTMPQIHIPKPCHENWDTMTATDQGRLCKKCSTVVTDFTEMSTEELIRYFEVNQGKKGCGRFRDDQVADPPVAYAMQQASFRQVVSLCLVMLLVFLSAPLPVSGKVMNATKPMELALKPGPTVSHYHPKLIRRPKNRRRSRRGRRMGAF